MSIIAGYTKESDGEYIVIGSFDTTALAESALDTDTSTDVKEYWIASFINSETNEPYVLGYIDV